MPVPVGPCVRVSVTAWLYAYEYELMGRGRFAGDYRLH
jgi:hypothetical protein